jgi:hypothetical protein
LPNPAKDSQALRAAAVSAGVVNLAIVRPRRARPPSFIDFQQSRAPHPS